MSLLTRNSMCRVNIAKPLHPLRPQACSTRRTCPTASIRVLCSNPGSSGRKILKPIWVPRGGHVLATTNAPNSLTSRVRPSLRFWTPLSVHQNTIDASKGNRIAFRVCPSLSTRHLAGGLQNQLAIVFAAPSTCKKPNVPLIEGICLPLSTPPICHRGVGHKSPVALGTKVLLRICITGHFALFTYSSKDVS